MTQPLLFALVALLALPTAGVASSLIVVEDLGGSSAVPYYQNLVPKPARQHTGPIGMGVRDSGSFPVTSERLTPGAVQARVINAPGLQPMFIVGDDELSKAWLDRRGDRLKQMQAIGVVVNVASAERFKEISKWAGGLKLVPASGDDVAGRLGIQHYPVLITATTLQQ